MLVALLTKLQDFLNQGNEIGADIPKHLQEKLTKALQEAEDSKLRVVLIGGYSEGKTSIASAWLGKKLDDMDISSAESTDEIKLYEPNNDIVLIDTPGLHGFKERHTGADVTKYQDITKHYISEAHIILYVMNPNNPIKESHKQDLQWLFRDLNLLNRSIFVLGKFDEMADISDENEYKEQYKIAQENVISGLKTFINLTQEEQDSRSITAVAPNPFELGLEHWLKNENKDEFKALSHIENLQIATTNAIEQNGGFEAIAQETQQSIVADVLHNQLPVLQQQYTQIVQSVEKFDESMQILNKDMQNITKEISAARIALRDFAMRYFTDLILQLEGTSIETFNEFFEREIGANGINLDIKIQNTFEAEVGSIYESLSNIQMRFQQESSLFEKALTNYGKQGIEFLKNSNFINANNVKIARDIVVDIGNIVGLELGKLLKFKPWGAIKFAKAANALLSILTLGLEIWDSYKQAERENAFQKVKQELKENFEGQRLEMLNMINSQAFIESFFASFLALQKQFEDIANIKKELEKQEQKFLEWKQNAQAIDVEFRELKK